MKKNHNGSIFLFLFHCVVYVLFFLFSFTQTDPNLTILNHPVWMEFQQFFWQIGYHQRPLATALYVVLVALLFVDYGLLLNHASEKIKRVALFFSIFILLISYPLFSHDIFNYMFNARMVVQYGVNPHTHTALEFSNDLWTRFMHNTHTSAPYGYAWTAFSLIPYVLGIGKFLLTLLTFKLFSLAGLLLLLWTQRKENYWWSFALHPLVLVETIAVGHNDAWMMFLWFFGVVLIQKNVRMKIVGVISILFSLFIKYATILIIPVELFRTRSKFFQQYYAEISAGMLSLLLLHPRTQWFYPWYLIWALSFLPSIHVRWVRALLFSAGLASMFRYAPYFFTGNYTDSSVFVQQSISIGGTFTIFMIWTSLSWLHGRMRK
ncbi:MAG: hypothetical protein UX04_C0001G0043 [Microgenomates group bacterium GW2011_GWF2_45_18]|nr:MAG: hypothetical protein UW18_C0003G0188 [Microgenomates group bacterium GW2011_GWF1_44_10]KKU02272.1 MAG: hypothetical protein UX04_C0001G0043 [Microgenomates group bacterium GW2011_GWF2_45_18]OGJ41238.1 MAG: hypothetical protein A2378_01580 [Candidatus Pacebacteria bacterium RIFOXYB1_FULL_44_10]HAU99263.1 hypothetical protein [Candidatus Paceibacterota bacterium]HAX01794.1 hypothetical protein [Candidatus Paceibacterota bacterium]